MTSGIAAITDYMIGSSARKGIGFRRKILEAIRRRDRESAVEVEPN
jgi:hypothetical protein